MRILIPAASFLALAACGGAATAEKTTSMPPAVNAQTTHGAVVRPRSEGALATRLDFPIQAVYDALPAVYDEVGISDVGTDPRARTVGNGRIIASRTFAGERLSRWLSCGQTAFGGQLADESRIELSVRTTVAPDGAGTTVRTLVEATARANRGTSSDAVECGSTGRLERRIADILRQRLQAAG